ncbi:C-type lectin domain family 4 member E-like [Pleurodeles waltl]|uniref:C-type lectin domain family 4 member E-like n=1 Tax=Pleurodeles waltl TaxID=8319 RepID=UPI0037094387
MKYIRCKDRTSGTDCGEFFYKDCPINWQLYNGNCYFFSQTTLSWANSRSSCQASQADLVIISNMKEQLFIRSSRKASFYWIGLTDQDRENGWKWVNGCMLQQQEAFWNSEQPDNVEGKEHCATVGSYEYCGSPKDWNDDRCEKKYKFICEKELEDRKMDFNLGNTELDNG